MKNELKNYDSHMDELVRYVSRIVAIESGNVLTEKQHSMVISRLSKRISDLEMQPNSYFYYLNDNLDRERQVLVSLLTTHYTFFFREFLQFEYLQKHLKEIVARVKKRGDFRINILSLGCSRGQEVYSLAMFFRHELKKYPGVTFKVLGIDIDQESIKVAKNGVYNFSEVKTIPFIYLSGNWQRGAGDISNFAKVKQQLKDYCEFKVENLLNLDKALNNRKFDLIFCRNVFIYFDQAKIKEIVQNSIKFLEKDALFVTGLSESLNSMDIDKVVLAPSVYCFTPDLYKTNNLDYVNILDNASSFNINSSIPLPIRVLIVDDSPTVVKILLKVFNNDESFEVVGVASNGKEAHEFLKKNKVDAMTLDIHMPEMDGVEYLKRYYNSKHPNVVIVSSASREDQNFAQQTLRFGASDFVEKPALNNLIERSDEIKNKIKMTFLNDFKDYTRTDSELFKEDFLIDNVSNKARVLISNFSDKFKIEKTLNSLKGSQPAVFLFFEGNNNFLEIIKNELNVSIDLKIFSGETKINANTVYLCDFNSQFMSVIDSLKNKRISIGIFGFLSKNVENNLNKINYNKIQILVEDLDEYNIQLKKILSDIFPWTSFSHVGTEFLSRE